MTAQNFCYWLQGFNEIQQTPPTPEQWKVIQDHLKLVFTKVTPERVIASGNVTLSPEPAPRTYCSSAPSFKFDGLPPHPFNGFPLQLKPNEIPATSC